MNLNESIMPCSTCRCSNCQCYTIPEITLSITDWLKGLKTKSRISIWAVNSNTIHFIFKHRTHTLQIIRNSNQIEQTIWAAADDAYLNDGSLRESYKEQFLYDLNDPNSFDRILKDGKIECQKQ